MTAIGYSSRSQQFLDEKLTEIYNQLCFYSYTETDQENEKKYLEYMSKINAYKKFVLSNGQFDYRGLYIIANDTLEILLTNNKGERFEALKKLAAAFEEKPSYANVLKTKNEEAINNITNNHFKTLNQTLSSQLITSYYDDTLNDKAPNNDYLQLLSAQTKMLEAFNENDTKKNKKIKALATFKNKAMQNIPLWKQVAKPITNIVAMGICYLIEAADTTTKIPIITFTTTAENDASLLTEQNQNNSFLRRARAKISEEADKLFYSEAEQQTMKIIKQAESLLGSQS